MPDVNCTVNTCKYWQQGNLCNAQQIVVQNDQSNGFSPNSELSNLAGTPACNSDQTCCQTFKNATGEC